VLEFVVSATETLSAMDELAEVRTEDSDDD
jgi:hypothetical protein